MDNLDVFKKNGFTFEINEDALPTKRVKLLTLPMSKNWIFGKSDIEELLFMLRVSKASHQLLFLNLIKFKTFSIVCKIKLRICVILSNTNSTKIRLTARHGSLEGGNFVR